MTVKLGTFEEVFFSLHPQCLAKCAEHQHFPRPKCEPRLPILYRPFTGLYPYQYPTIHCWMREISEALFELTSTRRKASCLQLAAHSAIRHDRSLQEITCAAWWTICSCGLCHLSPRLPATAVRYFRRVLISSYAGYCKHAALRAV